MLAKRTGVNRLIKEIKKLEFINGDLKWAPCITGNYIIDYKYGYECADKYSETIITLMGLHKSEDLIRANEKFRNSVDPETAAGRGFLAGIRGLKPEY